MTTGAETGPSCAAQTNRPWSAVLSLRTLRRVRTFGVIALCLLAGVGGCTAVDATAVKNDRAAGVTRTYARSPADLYQASVLGLESLRSDPNWRDLQITERDPAKGYVIAERDLDSAVIPGLGERDAIGVFVAETPDGDSAVTVVRMSSDQIPGSVGTSVNSARDASGLIFPAIDGALETIPEQPRQRVAAAPAATSVSPTTGSTTAAPPAQPATTYRAAAQPTQPATTYHTAAPAPAAPSASTVDRVYASLREGGTWRPLVREIAASGAEEIRIGTWAVLTTAGDRVLLRVKSKDGSPVDAARLALDLERAGFPVDVEAAGAR